jgi:hypothetical protein
VLHHRHDARYVEYTVETLVGQPIFGLVLGHEDLNDQDELRRDPTFAVLAGKSTAVLRTGCAALAGKSTLNRLEHRPRGREAPQDRLRRGAGRSAAGRAFSRGA